MSDRVEKSDADWKAELTPEQYRVLRKAGTEPAWSGPLNAEKRSGSYRCAGCGTELFSSDAKFDSKTGWPSFYAPTSDDAVETKSDRKLLFKRTEVLCATCDGHLGHVFSDGPRPTGQRYCMNSAALNFEPERSSS